ncbi:MAG: hypothetical protein CMF10_10275 [Idiomarina sp.]|nr:hypothetical protein [Idiomarina sp.]
MVKDAEGLRFKLERLSLGLTLKGGLRKSGKTKKETFVVLAKTKTQKFVDLLKEFLLNPLSLGER